MVKRKCYTIEQATAVLLSCVFFFVSASSQSYSFKHFTTNDGLVQTDITDIEQDKKGNIWIGTNGGISIFDGKTFTNYDDHDVLQSLRINAFLCDSTGVMWVATRNGLLQYKNGFRVFFKPNVGNSNLVSCLSANAQNLLIFVCNGIIYKVHNNRVEKIPVNNRIENNAALVAFDWENNLWIVTNDMKVYKKTFSQLTEIKTPFGAAAKRNGLAFMKILGQEGPVPYFVTNFGTLWVKNDSLCFFEGQYPQYRNANIGQATYVLEENDSTVWVGGVVGLSKLTTSNTTRYVKDNGFCDNSVSVLFTDREKNLWVGCTYNGVYKLGNEALFYLNPPNESIDLRHVSDVSSLSPQATLLSTWGKGLYLFANDSIKKIQLPPFLRYINCMFTLGNYTYIGWFGSGLWRLNNRTFESSLVQNFGKEESIAMIDKIGGSLIIQTLDNTCYLTDFDFNVKKSRMLSEDAYVTVVKDQLYLVSPSGQVSVLDASLNVTKRNIFPDVSSRITEILCYRDHFLVGSFGQGLFIFNQWGKLIKKLDKKNGLTTNIITGLLIDGNQLYIGTNLGLVKTDLPDFRSIRIFKEAEGMFSWECRQGGLRKLPNGAIFVATTNGPYLYYPQKDAGLHNASAVLSLADVRYGQRGDKRLAFGSLGLQTSSNEIAYEDNKIAITLKGISQRNPNDIVYYYQLDGYDSAWVRTADPKIIFGNLGPGDYKFSAYATVGNFQTSPVHLNFTIDRPLSGKLWFQVLLILFLSALSWVLLTAGNRLYQKYIQARMTNKLESEVAQKQQLTAKSMSFARHNYKELSDALRQKSKEKNLEYLTPVFLKEISQRIELLWKKETITLGEFHQYFDELLAGYAAGAKVYHKFSVDALEISMPVAFQLLEIFSLYFFIGLYKSETAIFSLDSENKSNGQLLMRFYNITHDSKSEKTSAYHFLKEAISEQRNPALTVDVIENLEYGNMIIAELNIHNEN